MKFNIYWRMFTIAVLGYTLLCFNLPFPVGFTLGLTFNFSCIALGAKWRIMEANP